MNTRIQKLRENSLNATNKISEERGKLVTEFYQSDEARGFSAPVTRAKCFYYIMDNKEICW